MMLRNLINDWFNDNKVKINSPVLGAFIGAWLIFNWKQFLLLFWGAGTLESRLSAFEQALSLSNFNMWIWPLLLALVYAFVLPYLNIYTQKILSHADKLRHLEVVSLDIEKARQKASLNEEIYKANPVNPYLGRKLETELKKMEAEADKARADAEKVEAERKEALSKQEAAAAEATEAKAKEAKTKRKEEHERQAHEMSKAKHQQEIANHQFPTLYLFLNLLSNSLQENKICLPLNLLSEAIAKCFGYDDFDSMLSNDAFTLSELEELACVAYEDKQLLGDLKTLVKKHKADIDEGELFDYLVLMFEELDTFKFIPFSSMDEVATDYLDDTSNLFDLVHNDSVNDQIAETNAHTFGVENPEFVSINQNSDGEFVAYAAAEIVGELADDKPYSGHKVTANFQLVYKPVIGNNGFAQPEIEDVSASLDRDY